MFISETKVVCELINYISIIFLEGSCYCKKTPSEIICLIFRPNTNLSLQLPQTQHGRHPLKRLLRCQTTDRRRVAKREREVAGTVNSGTSGY